MNFSSPTTLILASAIAAPIIAHLISKKMSKSIHFPSVRFIKKTETTTEVTKKIHDPLLLLLRIILFVSLCLFFAQPYLEQNLNETGAKLKHAVFIDLSASNLRQDFREKINENLDANLPDEAEFFCVFSADKILLEKDNLSKKQVIQELSKFNLDFSLPAKHRTALQKLNKISTEITGEIFVFSDMQIHAWKDLPKEKFSQEIDFIQTYPNAAKNLSIVSVQSQMISKTQLQLVATIKNHSNIAFAAKLKMNSGAQEILREIEVKARAQVEVKFTLPKQKQAKQVYLHILSDDDIQADNTFNTWLGLKKEKTVSILADEDNSAAKFIAKALSIEHHLHPRFLAKIESEKDFNTEAPLSIRFSSNLDKITAAATITKLSQTPLQTQVLLINNPAQSLKQISKDYQIKLQQHDSKIHSMARGSFSLWNLSPAGKDYCTRHKLPLNSFANSPCYHYLKFAFAESNRIKNLAHYDDQTPALIHISPPKNSSLAELIIINNGLKASDSQIFTARAFLPFIQSLISQEKSNKAFVEQELSSSIASKSLRVRAEENNGQYYVYTFPRQESETLLSSTELIRQSLVKSKEANATSQNKIKEKSLMAMMIYIVLFALLMDALVLFFSAKKKLHKEKVHE